MITRHFLATLLALMMIVGTSGTTIAQPTDAQSTFTTPNTKTTIDIGDSGDAYFDLPLYGYVITSSGYTQEDTIIYLGHAEITVSVLIGDITPQKWHADTFKILPTYYDHYAEILAEDTDDEFGWYLARSVGYAKITEYTYSEYVQGSTVGYGYSVYVHTHESTLTDDIAWIRDNLTVNGESFFKDADLTSVDHLITTEVNEADRLWNSDKTLEDWERFGLVSETEWIDPATGGNYTWTPPDLAFSFHFIYGINAKTDKSAYWLRLNTRHFEGAVYIYPLENKTAQTSEEFIKSNIGFKWLEWDGAGVQIGEPVSVGDSSGAIYQYESFPYRIPLVAIEQAIARPDGTITRLLVVAQPDAVARAYTDTIQNLFVDGEAIKPLWSESELEQLFSSGELSTVNADARHEETSVTRSNRTATTDEADEGTNPDRSSRTSRSQNSTASRDWSELGLISDSEWQGPISDISLSWDTNLWIFPIDFDDAIELGEGYESITLQTPDNRGEVTIMVDHDGYGTDIWFEAITDPNTFTDEQDRGMIASVVDTKTTAITVGSIILMDSPDEQLVVIVDVWVNEDGLTLITMIAAAPEDIADVYASFWDGVQSNGDYYPLTWEIEEIETLDIE